MSKKYVHSMRIECDVDGQEEPYWTNTNSGTPINIEQALKNFELAYSMANGLSSEQVSIDHEEWDVTPYSSIISFALSTTQEETLQLEVSTLPSSSEGSIGLNYQITDASEIPEIMAKAFYIARSGRPGPVLIDITKNAQFDKLDFEYEKCTSVRSYKAVPEVKEYALSAAAEIINEAKKPMIVFGQGVILGKAEEEFRTFIEKAGIPSAWTILGASAIPSTHPLNVGMVGMHGNYAPNVLTNECDVLIAIGMRFDDLRRMQVDIECFTTEGFQFCNAEREGRIKIT